MNVAVLALLYAAIYWGIVWYPARALEEAGMVGLWFTITSSGSALVLLTLLRGVDWRALLKGSPALWVFMLAAAWANVAFILAIIQDTVLRVMILFYLSPLWAVLLGRWLLHEKLNVITLWMLGLGLGGAVVMLWQPDMLKDQLGMGDFLAITAGFAFALMNVMVRKLAHVPVVLRTQLAWIGGILLGLLLLPVMQAPLPPVSTMDVWLVAAAIGIAGLLFATLATIYGVSRMPVQRSSVIMLFEVVVGASSAWWLAGEAIVGREWVGGAMVIAAGLVAVFAAEKQQQGVKV